jgi:RHS repeat-associated protein
VHLKVKVSRIVSAGFLALASAALANAQCYQFSGPGATLKINISGFNFSNPPVTVGGGKAASYLFSSANSLTIGQSTQTSNSFLDGAISIEYFPAVILPPQGFTQFQIVVPDATHVVTPRSGPHSWQAVLYGAGDLLPSGIVPVLPPISVWIVPPPSTLSNYIEVDSGTSKTKYPITSVTTCASTVDPNKTLGLACDIPGCVACGEPINLGTGNVFEHVTDYQTAGPNQLGFHRYYNSLAGPTYAVGLGVNWRSTYDRYLRISSTSVIAERADGRQLTFALSNGAWTTDPDVDYSLTSSGSTWTLTDSNDSVEIYNGINPSEALLQSIRARNGYTQTLQYDSSNQLVTATDSYSRQLSFAYTGGRLATVSTPDSLILSYGYTGNRLTSVAYSTTPPTSQTYLYENAALPSALTGIVDENGNRYVTWTYDSTGRGLTSQFAGGVDLTKIAYNDTDGSRTVTNALGAQTVYKFTTLQKAPKVTEIDRLANGTVAAATSKLTYDSNGYEASRTDWRGVLTTYTYDAHGQVTSVVEASGTPQSRSASITYHPTFHLPAKIVEPGLTTLFTYDTAGNLLTRTLADTTTTTTAPYPTSGQTRVWTYSWSNFLLASVRNPRTDVAALTQLTYDSSGALTARTNALGQTTRITRHLPGGLPQTIVDPNGVTAELTYDARLRLLTSSINTAAGPLTTSFSYDAAGNRTGVTLPDGSALTRAFDAAHRPTGVTDLFNQSAAIVLDPLGDPTSASLSDSAGTTQRTQSGKFDALGRLLQDIGAAGQTMAYTYDANGNPLTVTDPLTRVAQKSFDPLNRLVKLTDTAKGVMTAAYDAHNRPTSVTDPNGAVTTYVYDGFGDLIQRVSPDSGTKVYHYDAGGNATQSVDASGAVANHTYDALDRLLSTTYPADPAENVALTYDQPSAAFGIGRLTALTDAAGGLSLTYDERGNVVKETRVIGTVTLNTAYTYDAANRLSSIVYPSGFVVAYTRDSMGRTTAVSAQPPDGSPAVPVLSKVAYQPFGPVNSMTFGNGVTESRSFDQDYRLTTLTDTGAGALQSLTYSYDADDNVTKIADGVTAANSQTFAYDALNRLTAATGGYGAVAYTYDSVGNRLTQSQTGLNQASSAANYSYAPRSNQLVSVSAGGVNQAIGYTRTGHINSFNPAAAAITNLTYNQAGRLASATAGSDPAAQYTYDAFGHRLVKTGASTTLYQYDRSALLLEETDGQGNPLVDYIYLDALPVAALSPGAGQVYFLHDDRLGAPQVATDSGQTVVWSAGYGPFGEMTTVPSLIVQNLRLPGQEYDGDTGLYHNGFRDYAPGWGRYLQSDPIGLAGGPNTYSYAAANPVKLIDPFGLQTDPPATPPPAPPPEDGVKSNTLNFVDEEWQKMLAGVIDLGKIGLDEIREGIEKANVCRIALEEKIKNASKEDYKKLAEYLHILFELSKKEFAKGAIGAILSWGCDTKDKTVSCGDYCTPQDCPAKYNAPPMKRGEFGQ